MSLETPTHKKNIQNIIKKETPIETNKVNDKKKNNNFEQDERFKTISHLKRYNNLDNDNLNKVSLKLFEENRKDNLHNNTESNINHIKNVKEKLNYKQKNINTSKNKNNIVSERKNENKIINIKKNILSESYNNTDKLKRESKIENILFKDNNIHLDKKQNDEESENLSELAEDLLSLSEGYNAEIMRKGPINKNDFIGESKEIYNINKDKKNNLINNSQNQINLDPSRTMPKLQTKIYSSPLDKLNLKNMDNFYNIKKRNKKINNNLNNNFYNFRLDDINTANIMQTQMQSVVARTFPSKIRNHISSSSMKNIDNNNINNKVNNKDNNYTILNNLISSGQFVKNNNIINHHKNNLDNIFNKTVLNQYNKNDYIDLDRDTKNNMNNNLSVGKNKINLHVNNNNSNRNLKRNLNIKQFNSINSKNISKNNNEFLSKDYLKNNNNNNDEQILINQRNNIKVNNIKNMNNMNNLNNSNYIQNLNSIINLSNNYANNNYKISNNINKYPIQSQILKKTQTFIGSFQNNQKQGNNIEFFNKNLNNINMGKNKVLNNNIKYTKNYDTGQNELNFSSKIQNKIKNYQSNKLLRKSDYYKYSNKNELLNMNTHYKNKKNYYSNANKNSYKNIYNYTNININEKQTFFDNKYTNINDEDMIHEYKQPINLNSKYSAIGYKAGNIYINQGQNKENGHLTKNNYLNKKLELEAY